MLSDLQLVVLFLATRWCSTLYVFASKMASLPPYVYLSGWRTASAEEKRVRKVERVAEHFSISVPHNAFLLLQCYYIESK